MMTSQDGVGSPPLNSGQVQCLLLVGDHLTSKEIAKKLGISRHTVDQRIRDVLRATGARSRREAAQFIKRGVDTIPADEIVEPWPDAPVDSDQSIMAPVHDRTGLMWPFETYPGQSNTMGLSQRMFWILTISVCAVGASAMYMAGLESLGRVIAGH